jgi:hypothetical protein
MRARATSSLEGAEGMSVELHLGLHRRARWLAQARLGGATVEFSRLVTTGEDSTGREERCASRHKLAPIQGEVRTSRSWKFRHGYSSAGRVRGDYLSTTVENT